jgi:hypothetical protein
MKANTFIPEDIKCFWCNGRMERGTYFTSPSINHITYFCRSCGAVSHFAVNHKCKISSIEVEYKTTNPAGTSDAEEP